MNITRLNFAQTLPFIKNIINQSHYISIDLEMSGIVSDIESNPSLVDSLQQRYLKTKKRIEKFIPLQIGVCCHKIDTSTNKVIFYPFNFYIYPLSLQQADSIKFAFHSSTMDFLAKNSFDFNKLFYQYVPYISKEELANVSQRKQQNSLMKQLMRLDSLNSPATKAFINMNFPLVQKWIQQNSSDELKINIQYMKYKSYKMFIDEIQRNFPSISFQFEFDSQQIFNRNWLSIKRKTSNDEGFQFDQQNQKTSNMLINEVIDCIVENKLPIIVHNGFLDLMHIFLRFFQKLPPNWQIFCKKLHLVFPYLYDTKFICSNYPVLFQTLERMTNLQNCYLKLKQDYQKKDDEQKKDLYTIEIDKDFKEYTLEGDASHQAGFDALMTGYVFFRAMGKLKKPLQSLEKRQFHRTPSLMRNRILMGNIKVPLNLEQQNDFYSQHGNTRFEVRSLLKTIHTEQQFVEYFKKQEGAVNFYWKDQTKTSFFITFIDKKDEIKFLSKNLDTDGLGILQFLNDKYLFTTLKKQKNDAHNQTQEKNV